MRKALNIILLLGLGLFFVSSVTFAGETAYFASLKKDRVNLRTGPGERFPIIWVYQERDYPVEVLDKYDIWYQIREVDGTIGWVHQNMVGKTRTALVQEEYHLMNRPTATGKPIALIQKGTIAKVNRCQSESDYCLVSFSHGDKILKGWLPRKILWGLYSDEEVN